MATYRNPHPHRHCPKPTIAEALLTAHDLDHFKQMLIPCAFSLESAYAMCGLLARAYPQQAAAVITRSKHTAAQG